MDTKNKALLEFMMEKLGGEDAVKQQLYSTTVAELAKGGATLHELIDGALKDGWKDALLSMKLTDLARAVMPTPLVVANAVNAADADDGIRRMTAKDVDALREQILEYIEANPWCRKGDIAESVTYPKSKIGPQLRVLYAEGKIQKTGQKAGTEYALPGVGS